MPEMTGSRRQERRGREAERSTKNHEEADREAERILVHPACI